MKTRERDRVRVLTITKRYYGELVAAQHWFVVTFVRSSCAKSRRESADPCGSRKPPRQRQLLKAHSTLLVAPRNPPMMTGQGGRRLSERRAAPPWRHDLLTSERQ
mmetsp:Transcript_2273/g.7252  ORF Transcript_2273/g.7252 Transcript_2273/m.7252 type:complete len:105 (-) Transcript_2273:495-809(-)